VPLQLFYRFPAAACWLLAHADSDIFLEDSPASPASERPHLVKWYYRPHLVIAELRHSQLVIAAQLDSETPRIEWGDDGAKCPLNYPPRYFNEWLAGIAQEILAWNPREARTTIEPKLNLP
jgi:hypothetical protein